MRHKRLLLAIFILPTLFIASADAKPKKKPATKPSAVVTAPAAPAAPIVTADSVCGSVQMVAINGGNVECEHAAAAEVAAKLPAGTKVVQQAGTNCDGSGQYQIAKHDVIVLPSGFLLKDAIYAWRWIKDLGLANFKAFVADWEDYSIRTGERSISPFDCHSLTPVISDPSPGLR